jgi:uncharacterized protein YoxC
MDLSLSVGIIAVLFTVNSIFFIVVVFKVIKATGEAQKLIELIRMHIAPLSHDATQITSDIRSVVKSIEKQVDNVGVSVSHIRDTARNIKEFE